MWGERHPAQSEITVIPRIRRHSNSALASPTNIQVGVSSAPGVGGESTIAGGEGMAVSSSYVRAVIGLTLPAASVWRTSKV